MSGNDNTADIVAQVSDALDKQSTINIVGSNSKHFLGRTCDAERTLDMTSHHGVVSYEPTELVVTVRAGTRVADLKQQLYDNGQMLPFEPPVMGDGTIGGVLACGLSGPARMFAGSARDYVLGMRVVNGRGEALRFGGEVMKNVAGYDAARLQVGAFGTLGVLLETSMKVLPLPEAVVTLVHAQTEENDTSAIVRLMRQPIPLSAAAIVDDKLYLRLSGSESAVNAAAAKLAGDRLPEGDAFWHSLNELSHPFFTDDRPLWRISMPEFAPMPAIEGDWLLDWAGAQRWLLSNEPASRIYDEVQALNGHATSFSSAKLAHSDMPFQPLSGAVLKLQRRLRHSFDPQHVFNPGRFHPELDSVKLETES